MNTKWHFNCKSFCKQFQGIPLQRIRALCKYAQIGIPFVWPAAWNTKTGAFCFIRSRVLAFLGRAPEILC